MFDRPRFVQDIIDSQPKEIRETIDELESRGLGFCKQFGYENCEQILAEMNDAMNRGDLYEWMERRCGIVTDERV